MRCAWPVACQQSNWEVRGVARSGAPCLALVGTRAQVVASCAFMLHELPPAHAPVMLAHKGWVVVSRR